MRSRIIMAACALVVIACRDSVAPVGTPGPGPGPGPNPDPNVNQALVGRLVTAGDVGRLTDVRITLRRNVGGVVREFTSAADAAGAFEIRAEFPTVADDSLDLIVSSGTGEPRFAPIYKRIAGTDRTSFLRPLLIARSITIPTGTYAGATVVVDLRGAFTPICSNPSSAGCIAYFGLWKEVPVLWPRDAFPIPLAFYRRQGSPAITASDSAAFWANVAILEAEFGRDLFRPVDIGALGVVTFDGLPERGTAVSIDPAAAPALAGAWVQDGRLVKARARVGDHPRLRQRYVMNHELVHVLGFGHTCAWSSLMCGASAGRPAATAGDVAAFLLAYLVDDAVRVHAPTTTMADALRGEMVFARPE